MNIVLVKLPRIFSTILLLVSLFEENQAQKPAHSLATAQASGGAEHLA